jgi:hypothetical protein
MHVRFGSKADICSAKWHVRFAPNSDRKSGHAAMVMSALPPKADMYVAPAHVCFGPIADIRAIRFVVAVLSKDAFDQDLSARVQLDSGVNDKDDALKMLPTGAVGFAVVTLLLAALWLVSATHHTDALSPNQTWNVD